MSRVGGGGESICLKVGLGLDIMWLRAAKGLVNLRASSYQPSMRDNATRATILCAVLFINACIHS